MILCLVPQFGPKSSYLRNSACIAHLIPSRIVYRGHCYIQLTQREEGLVDKANGVEKNLKRSIIYLIVVQVLATVPRESRLLHSRRM